MTTADRKDLKISKNRLEALVDGIFAFAMTLLVTGLAVPHFSKQERP
ncbi:MAG: TMEM175 family protein [Syntrophales bacterium]|nr:TMEM175 family protein [Syntrophales bacterium]